MATATLSTVAAYLTAAQAALTSGNYAEARKQAVLAQMELAKLPASHSSADGLQTQYRADIAQILKNLDNLQDRDSTREHVLGVWGDEPW